MLIDSKWYALQVKAKWEERVSLALMMKGYDVFAPTFLTKKVRRGRAGQVRVPMFPTYVFCRYDRTIAQRMVESPGVIRLVGFGNQPTSVDDGEIASLQVLYHSGAPASPWQFFKDGQRVRITSGVLKGVEGHFVRDKDARRVIINITLLQRSVMVELDGELIDALPTPTPIPWRGDAYRASYTAAAS